MRLWLVRHGATDWSERGRLCGWSDVPLSPVGLAQAESLRSRLAGREFDGVWTSDLARSAEHAEVAYGGAQSDPRLRELDFGDLDGEVWDALDHATQEAMARFDEFAAPGGERLGQLETRVLEFLSELDGGDHLIFTHGGVIRLLCRRQGIHAAPAPGELIVLEVEGTMTP